MKKIKCLIVDDSALARSLLENHLSKMTDFQVVASCEDVENALEVLKRESIDLIFSDIEMPKINGLDFIKNLNPAPVVILTTAYSEFALQGFELGVVDYLLKPITFARFQVAAERAKALVILRQKEQTETEKLDFFLIKSSGKQIKIFFNDILFLQSNADYITIHTTEKRITFHGRMKNIITQLPDNQFVRIHNSYIVNKQKISTFHNDKVEINGILLPISEKYRSKIKNSF
jgi:two-component system, LytTR family, response regulator